MTPLTWALLLCAACGGRSSARVVLHDVQATAQVVVFRNRQGEAKPVVSKDFKQAVMKALARARHLAVEPGAEPPSSRLRVEAMLEIDLDAREGRAAVAMRTDRGAVPLTVTVVEHGPTRDADDRTLLGAALASATRALDAQAELVLADDAGVLRAIDGGDDDVRILAARLAAARRVRGAGAHIAKLLRSPRQEVRDAAIGSLIELRDPSAVRPLIESAASDDPEAQLRVVEALSAIGGDEAAQYLELLASGSEEPDIREAASRARARLARTGR